MKFKLFTLGCALVLSVVVLSGCGPAPVQTATPTAGGADVSPIETPTEVPAELSPIETPTTVPPVAPTAAAELANPASAYCLEQGYTLDIRTAADGSQYGVCIFPDGSECDEWAFFRGECGPAPLAAPAAGQAVVAWLGHIASLPAGSQYDDYLALVPEGTGAVGLTGADTETEEQIKLLRDRQGVGEYVHVWGTLTCDVPDYGGCQIVVSRLRYGQTTFDPDPVEGWEGTITSGTFNGGLSNVFVLAGGFPVWHSIDSNDPAIRAQLDGLRDTQTVVRAWGELMSGVPDVNGTRVQVTRLDIVEEVPAPVETRAEPVQDWAGVIVSNPPGAQFDDYFELQSARGGSYGIDSLDADVRARIVALRDAGTTVRVWGTLHHDVPDVNGTQIEVTRLEVQEPAATPEITEQVVDGWVGRFFKLPPGNQFGGYFERSDGQRFDVGSADPAVSEQIEEAHWTGAQVQVWGQLFTGVPAIEARHIEVERVEVTSGPALEPRNLSPFAALSESSALPTDRGGTYHGFSAIDGLLESAWVEGATGPGIGEWIMLTFPDTIVVDQIGVDVGFDRDADIFAKNNRLKRATVRFSNGEEIGLEFSDTRGVQVIDVSPVETTLVQIVIDEVYPGSRYDDTCLAEVEVWGRTQ